MYSFILMNSGAARRRCAGALPPLRAGPTPGPGQDPGFRVQGSGYRVQGAGFRVQGWGAGFSRREEGTTYNVLRSFT